MKSKTPLKAADIPPVTTKSNYPEAFKHKVEGRVKRRLGDYFDLENFGVNLTILAPNSQTALHHAHEKQDELIYVLKGSPCLVIDDQRFPLEPGMVAGFPKGGQAHHLINETDEEVHILEIGDRTAGDCVIYPDDDLVARMVDGAWTFTRKDGTPYDN